MKEKYLVYKINYETPEGDRFVGPLLKDCVVIRLQDRFAAAGLHGYASAIQSVIEAAKEADVPLPDNLEDIRDYFFEMAEAAEQHPNKKWPD